MGHLYRGAVGLAVVLAGVAHAEPPAQAELKLVDVIRVAVRQSPDLERARIDLDAARAALLQAEGAADTHVGADATGSFSRTSSTDPAGALDTEDLTVGVSGTQPLPSGGTLGVVVSTNRHRGPVFGADNMTVDVLRYASSLSLRFTQPLLRGAGSTAFEAPIRRTTQQRDAAVLAREARARDVLVSVTQAYWQVAFALRQLEVRKASLELANQQLRDTESALRAEKVSRSETVAVLQAIATRKQDVLASEQDVYERSLALRQLGGLEIGPGALAVTTEPLPTTVAAGALDVDTVVREAFAHSAELAGLEATRRAAEVNLAAAENAARARLDLDVTGGPAGFGSSLGESVKGAVDTPGFAVSANLIYDQSVQRRVERGGVEAARAAVMAAKIAERDAQAKLAVRATRAVQRANAALASIALGAEAIGYAEQNVTFEKRRFEIAKSTNNDVLRRQDELEQARLRHASAIADYLAARVDLDGLSGAILSRYGIVMQ
jgi:HAE1 family hydrophobic/amphiphilic exporter-1